MVAVLWKEGNFVAALQLEELWNELQRRTPFSLFCAYPLRHRAQPGRQARPDHHGTPSST